MKEFWATYKNAIFSIGTTILLSALLFVGGMLFSCKSITVYNIKGQPQSCNDMYTEMDRTLKAGDKSTALIALWMKQCQDDREYIKKKDCLLWVYHGTPLDNKNYQLYGYYQACMASK